MNQERMGWLEDCLVAAVEDRVPVRFHLGTWYQEMKCGTTACAAGLLALDPRARAAGLKFG